MTLRVLIVGAGIGGLSAALELSRIGARVSMVERAPELLAIGAGVQLSPNATRILRRLGLLDELAERATRPTGIRVRSGASARTLSFMSLADAERRWGAPYLVARRADLQDVLAAAVAADGGIDLRLGTALAGFGTVPGGVQANLKQGLLTRTLEVDALIGADGIRSTVRARLVGAGGDAPTHAGRLAWRALVEAAAIDPPPPAGETGLWLGADAHLVHYPVDGGRLLNVVAVTRSDTGEARDETWSEPGDPAEIRARFARWHPKARAVVGGAATWSRWPLFERQKLEGWNAGPVALLGDAAHPILPFLAQGAAQAIEDGAALAGALAGTREVAAALANYSRARLARAARVQVASRRLGRIYHLAGPAALARNAAIGAMGSARLLGRYDWLYDPQPAAHVT